MITGRFEIETGHLIFEDDTDGTWQIDHLTGSNTWTSEDNGIAGGWNVDSDSGTSGTWWDD